MRALRATAASRWAAMLLCAWACSLPRVGQAATGTWLHFQSDGTGYSGFGTACTIDTRRGEAVMFGMWNYPVCFGLNCTGYQNFDVTAFARFAPDPVVPPPSTLGPSPRARSNACAAYDSLADQVWLFGGRYAVDSLCSEFGCPRRPALDDLWQLDVTAPAWREIAVTGARPAARYDAGLAVDPFARRLLLFGGHDSTGTAYGDLWSIPLAGPYVWSELHPAGVGPSPRWSATALVDPIRQRLLLVGGSDPSGSVTDVWALDLAGSPAWSVVNVTGTAPAGVGHACLDGGAHEHRDVRAFGSAHRDRARCPQWPGELEPRRVRPRSNTRRDLAALRGSDAPGCGGLVGAALASHPGPAARGAGPRSGARFRALRARVGAAVVAPAPPEDGLSLRPGADRRWPGTLGRGLRHAARARHGRGRGHARPHRALRGRQLREPNHVGGGPVFPERWRNGIAGAARTGGHGVQRRHGDRDATRVRARRLAGAGRQPRTPHRVLRRAEGPGRLDRGPERLAGCAAADRVERIGRGGHDRTRLSHPMGRPAGRDVRWRRAPGSRPGGTRARTEPGLPEPAAAQSRHRLGGGRHPPARGGTRDDPAVRCEWPPGPRVGRDGAERLVHARHTGLARGALRHLARAGRAPPGGAPRTRSPPGVCAGGST